MLINPSSLAKRSLFCCFLVLLLFEVKSVGAQDTKEDSLGRYKFNMKWELPASGAFIAASYFGFRLFDNYASMDAADVNGLNPSHINAFDRPGVYMDTAHFQRAQDISDLLLNISACSPIILALDKKVRGEWKDIAGMFLEAHAVDNALYFAAVATVRRARPLTYIQGYDLNKRTGIAKSNSFFSGHVSFSATSTFFAAKVYTDLHELRGWKRTLIFAGAAVPPLAVGYYRVRAGRHFRTDVLTGLVVGAATGILIPQLHKTKPGKHKTTGLSLSPVFGGGYTGFTMTMGL